MTPGGAAAGFLARLQEAAGRFPERIAHVGPDGPVSYAALEAAARGLAGRLAAEGSRSPVLVYGHKETGMPAALWACGLAGRAFVPADAGWPAARVARIAVLAGARLCLAARTPPPDLAAALLGAGLRTLALGADGAPADPGPAGPLPAGPTDPAYIIFTSGSTGDPKGVPVPWSALDHFANWLLAEQDPAAGTEVVLNQAPFSFDLSVMDLSLALLSGGTLFSITAEMVAAPRILFPTLAASGLSTWVSTPSFARFCLAEPSFAAALLPRLRRFLFCGETLPPEVARTLLRRFPGAAVWNTYGPTETTVAVTSLRLTPEALDGDAPLPVGTPAPGMRVLVVDAGLRPLPEGETGEILIAGPQVAGGYLPPVAGAAPPPVDRFLTLPPELGGGRAYRTGDAGHFSGGLLHCAGRLDRQVKLHGYRLELEEIEAHLRRLPGVADAAVLTAPVGGTPAYLVAFVALQDGRVPAGSGFAQAQEMRRALATTLPAYALPRAVRFLPALPLSGNGKLDRRGLEGLLP